MGTTILDRADYEVFFRLRARGEKTKKARKLFLAEHSPYSPQDFFAVYQKCGIGGGDYEMITLIESKIVKSIIRKKTFTQTALLIEECNRSGHTSIQCGNEYLSLERQPISMHLDSLAEPLPKAEITITSDDLRSSMTRARPLKVNSRGQYALIAAFAACMLVTAIPISNALVAHTEKTQRIPTPASAAKPTRAPSFWEFFYAELDAISAAGGTIESFSFDQDRAQQTTATLIEPNVQALAEAIHGDARLSSCKLGDMAYVAGERRIPISLKWESYQAEKNTFEDLSIVARFSDCIALQGGTLSAVKFRERPRYAFSIPRSKIAGFVTALRRFCEVEAAVPTTLIVTGNGKGNSCAIEIELARVFRGDETNVSARNESDLAALFPAMRTAKTQAIRTPQIEKNMNRIGTIRINAQEVVFTKDEQGKISSERKDMRR